MQRPNLGNGNESYTNPFNLYATHPRANSQDNNKKGTSVINTIIAKKTNFELITALVQREPQAPEQISHCLFHAPQMRFNFHERLQLFTLVHVQLQQGHLDNNYKTELETCQGFLYLSFHDSYQSYRHFSRAAEKGSKLAICAIARRLIAEGESEDACARLNPLLIEDCPQAFSLVAYAQQEEHFLNNEGGTFRALPLQATHFAAAASRHYDPLAFYVLARDTDSSMNQSADHVSSHSRTDAEKNYALAAQLGLNVALYQYADIIKEDRDRTREAAQSFRDYALNLSICSEYFYRSRQGRSVKTNHNEAVSALKRQYIPNHPALTSYYLWSLYQDSDFFSLYYQTKSPSHSIVWLYHFTDPSQKIVKIINEPSARAAIVLRILYNELLFVTMLSWQQLGFIGALTQRVATKRFEKDLAAFKTELQQSIATLEIPYIDENINSYRMSDEHQSRLVPLLLNIAPKLGFIKTQVQALDLTTYPFLCLQEGSVALNQLLQTLLQQTETPTVPHSIKEGSSSSTLQLPNALIDQITLEKIKNGNKELLQQLTKEILDAPAFKFNTESRLTFITATFARLAHAPIDFTPTLNCLLGILFRSVGEMRFGLYYSNKAWHAGNALARVAFTRSPLSIALDYIRVRRISTQAFGETGLATLTACQVLTNYSQAIYSDAMSDNHIEKARLLAAEKLQTEAHNSEEAMVVYANAWIELRSGFDMYNNLKKAQQKGMHIASFDMARLLAAYKLNIPGHDSNRLAAMHARDYALQACYDNDFIVSLPLNLESGRTTIEAECRRICKDMLNNNNYPGLYSYYSWTMWANESTTAFCRLSAPQPLLWLYHFSDANAAVPQLIANPYHRMSIIFKIFMDKLQDAQPSVLLKARVTLFNQHPDLTALTIALSALEQELITAKTNGFITAVPNLSIPEFSYPEGEKKRIFLAHQDTIIQQLNIIKQKTRALALTGEPYLYFTEGRQALAQCQNQIAAQEKSSVAMSTDPALMPANQENLQASVVKPLSPPS